MHRRSSLPTLVLSALVLLGATMACLGPGTLNTSQCEATGPKLIQSNCVSCHSASLSGTQRAAAPQGVNFDTEGDIQRWAASIRDVTIVRKTMPPGAPLPECALATLDGYLTELAQKPCIASCSGRQCGSDGCGGACGTCGAGETCDETYGQCRSTNCTADCTGAACGADGCGGSCGSCSSGLVCSPARQCVCQPNCSGKQCGPDGCGGQCGQCATNAQCSLAGQCVCIPNCTGKECGNDGCGGTCGTCGTDLVCNASSQCECSTSCPPTKRCGPNACGFNCGDCNNPSQPFCKTTSPTNSSCSATCTPNCTGKTCGDDGCGGTCGLDGGVCGAGQQCTGGSCVCAPSCEGKTCGPNGCGGACGSLDGGCAAGLACTNGQCGCVPNCTGRVCGSDGCGGSCAPGCSNGQACSAAGQCVCAPQCAGKSCGDDGCGGSCGTCASGGTCNAGQCAFPSKSYAADVHPILQPNCSSAGCHAGGPAEPLDFRTASAGYASLVNKSSTQCNPTRLLVKPSDIAASYVVNKLTGQGMCSGSPMPKGAGSLTQAQLDTIRAWIGSGAAP